METEVSDATSVKTIAILGAGQMAEALVGGLLAAELYEPSQIFATDVSADRLSLFKQRFGVRTGVDNREAAAWGQVILLAVKPQVLSSVLDDVRAAWKGQLVISIAAGVPVARISAQVPSGARIVRVMPNAPALVRAGMSAIAIGSGVSDEESRFVRRLFDSVGRVVLVDESLMDAVTGLSGSGPAYACVAIEALADGGVKMGLPRPIAERLAVQTVLGAARMVVETGVHPARLKDSVASPGGTTIAGLHELERGGMRAALIAAVEAATKRSRELGA